MSERPPTAYAVIHYAGITESMLQTLWNQGYEIRPIAHSADSAEALLRDLRTFVRDQAIRGGPPIEQMARVMAEIDRMLAAPQTRQPAAAVPDDELGYLHDGQWFRAAAEGSEPLTSGSHEPEGLDVERLRNALINHGSRPEHAIWPNCADEIAAAYASQASASVDAEANEAKP